MALDQDCFAIHLKAILLCLVAYVAAGALLPVAIVRQNIESADDGSYKHRYKRPNYLRLSAKYYCNFFICSFETENGIKVEESGSLKQITPEAAGTASRGSYSYTAPDGTVITTNWVADENGFRATGAHLPVALPMPDHVVKLLADLRAAGVL